MITIGQRVSSRTHLQKAVPALSPLALASFCSCCFGQLPVDLALPSQTVNSGSPVFQASTSITNSDSFVVQDAASATLAAGSYIRLVPGFHAVGGSAPFTFFALIDPNVSQGPPDEGNGPPSIPFSYTAPDHSPECNNISGKWVESDNIGNSIGWDLNQNGPSISGTLFFDDYRNFGSGLTYCGRITYSASGVSNGSSFSLSANNPVPSVDSCGYSLAPSEAETVTLSGQACGSGNGAYTISGGGGGGPALSRLTPQPGDAQASRSISASVRPAQTSGASTWTTYSPRFNVSYAAYIPVDNIRGPTPCYYSGAGGLPSLNKVLYKGDANRGTYRTTQAIFVASDKQYYGNPFVETGATRSYGKGSPANGSTLSSYPTSSDIYNGPYAGADEDNPGDDCHYWHRKGKALKNLMPNPTVTFGNNQAVVTISGSAKDPLEDFFTPQFGAIRWSATITLDTSDPSNPTAQATMTHTCYPAHIVKVNGVTILDVQPQDNKSSTLRDCLIFPTLKTDSSGVIRIPNH